MIIIRIIEYHSYKSIEILSTNVFDFANWLDLMACIDYDGRVLEPGGRP